MEVGAVAHGGHCVARLDGRVLFVRHALPGERVRALITEDGGGSYARADAVEVIRPAPERVAPPCPHSGPGRCGGCDFQHVSADGQRRLKAAVVREQFARLAGLDVAVEVEELAGGLLGWRTRIGYAVGDGDRLGLLRHRSRQVERLDACPLGVSGVGDAAVIGRTWTGESRVEVVRDDDGQVTVLAARAPRRGARPPRSRASGGRTQPARPGPSRVVEGSAHLHHVVDGLGFEVAAGGFWQVHPAAAATFAHAVLDELAPRPGESVLDLYAGAGLFTALLARAVGPAGRVLGLESDPRAVEDAAGNLRAQPWAEVRRARVSEQTLGTLELIPDLVVLDPPRAGAGEAVMAAIVDLGAGSERSPRAIAYVACDPASLARDIAIAGRRGWRLGTLRAFDAFPMTHHVECIATLTPN